MKAMRLRISGSVQTSVKSPGLAGFAGLEHALVAGFHLGVHQLGELLRPVPEKKPAKVRRKRGYPGDASPWAGP